MSCWYEVFDNVDVQLMTRRQAAGLTGFVTVVIVATIACLAFGIGGTLPLVSAITASAIVWAAFSWWLIRRLRRLRRLVWCVKLSRREIVGYDFTRKKVRILWREVERIEIGDKGLVVVGPAELSLEVAHLFPEFAEVSHRIVYYAEAHRLPIFIDGRPWQQLDVYAVYPFLSGDTSSPRRGSATV